MTNKEAAEILKTLIFEDPKLNDAVCVVLSALRTWQESKKFSPPCYQPDQFGDGCAYQCYDGDDEPIDKCKECPLCNSDKHRKQQAPEKNEPLTIPELLQMDTQPVFVLNNDGNGEWRLVDAENKLLYGLGEDDKIIYCGTEYTAYRHPPKGGADEHI